MHSKLYLSGGTRRKGRPQVMWVAAHPLDQQHRLAAPGAQIVKLGCLPHRCSASTILRPEPAAFPTILPATPSGARNLSGPVAHATERLPSKQRLAGLNPTGGIDSRSRSVLVGTIRPTRVRYLAQVPFSCSLRNGATSESHHGEPPRRGPVASGPP